MKYTDPTQRVDLPSTPVFINNRDEQVSIQQDHHQKGCIKTGPSTRAIAVADHADPAAVVLGEDAQVGTTLTVEASNASADSSMFMVGRGIGTLQQYY